MAFSSVPTITTGDVATAAWGNTYLKDNFATTAAAVLTTTGDVIYASGANTPARLAKSTTSTQYLANTGSSNVPAWNEVALATGVSGTLPVGNGGTGATSLTANGVIIGNTASALTSVDMSTKGHLLIGDGSGNPRMLAVGSDNAVLTADSGETTGVKWQAPGGALVVIGTAVASDSSSLTVTGLDSTYDTYMIAISDMRLSVDDSRFYLRLGDSSGVDSGASDYSYHMAGPNASSTSYSADASRTAAQMAMGASLGNGADEGVGAVLFLHRPADGTTQPMLSGTWTGHDTGTTLFGGFLFGMRNAVITLDRVQVLFSGVCLITSGRLTVLGVKHA